MTNEKQNVAQLLERATEQLKPTSETARLDAEVLLQYYLNCSASRLVARANDTIVPAQAHTFDQLVKRRQAGEPVAYITGHREFWSMDLLVTPDTLIPRPETELLIEKALESIPLYESRRVLDLGTGTGAIALAIAKERPLCFVLGVDSSAQTVTTAAKNKAILDIDNVVFKQSNWFSTLGGQRFDFIVSNPPYVSADDSHLLQGDVRFEPRLALDGGEDGMRAIRQIVAQSKNYLSNCGWCLLEHGFDQHIQVTSLFKENGFMSVQTYKDLNHHPRVTMAQMTS